MYIPCFSAEGVSPGMQPSSGCAEGRCDGSRRDVSGSAFGLPSWPAIFWGSGGDQPSLHLPRSARTAETAPSDAGMQAGTGTELGMGALARSVCGRRGPTACGTAIHVCRRERSRGTFIAPEAIQPAHGPRMDWVKSGEQAPGDSPQLLFRALCTGPKDTSRAKARQRKLRSACLTSPRLGEVTCNLLREVLLKERSARVWLGPGGPRIPISRSGQPV